MLVCTYIIVHVCMCVYMEEPMNDIHCTSP